MEIKQLEIKVSTQYDLEKKPKKIHYEKKYPHAMWLWKMAEYKYSNIVQIDTQTLIDRGWELRSKADTFECPIRKYSYTLYMKY